MNAMGFIEDFTEGLNALVGPGREYENPHQLAQKLGKSSSQVTRYLAGERTKHLGAIGEVLDALEFKLLKPKEQPGRKEPFDLSALHTEITRVLCEMDADANIIKAVSKVVLDVRDKRQRRRA
jgi:transcriptional regulator with XRE-family HTH domain